MSPQQILTTDDNLRVSMLQALSLRDLQDLFDVVPEDLRLNFINDVNVREIVHGGTLLTLRAEHLAALAKGERLVVHDQGVLGVPKKNNVQGKLSHEHFWVPGQDHTYPVHDAGGGGSGSAERLQVSQLVWPGSHGACGWPGLWLRTFPIYTELVHLILSQYFLTVPQAKDTNTCLVRCPPPHMGTTYPERYGIGQAAPGTFQFPDYVKPLDEAIVPRVVRHNDDPARRRGAAAHVPDVLDHRGGVHRRADVSVSHLLVHHPPGDVLGRVGAEEPTQPGL